MYPSEVAELIRNPNLIAGDDYAIIDVRRDDYEVGLAIPIQSRRNLTLDPNEGWPHPRKFSISGSNILFGS